MSYNKRDVLKASQALERAYQILFQSEVWPYSEVRQAPLLVETAESEIESAKKLLDRSK